MDERRPRRSWKRHDKVETVKVGLSKEDCFVFPSGFLVLIRLPLGSGESVHFHLLEI